MRLEFLSVIYDIRGRLVRTLVDASLPAAVHVVDWYGKDEAGRAMASGVYLARLTCDGDSDVRKITLLR